MISTQPAPCRRTNAHTPHDRCPGTAPEFPSERVEEVCTIGSTRACPDCGRPQHYTGTEHGWAHDALIDTWHCAGEHVRANKTSERGA